jgi:hypothetical protein
LPTVFSEDYAKADALKGVPDNALERRELIVNNVLY